MRSRTGSEEAYQNFHVHFWVASLKEDIQIERIRMCNLTHSFKNWRFFFLQNRRLCGNIIAAFICLKSYHRKKGLRYSFFILPKCKIRGSGGSDREGDYGSTLEKLCFDLDLLQNRVDFFGKQRFSSHTKVQPETVQTLWVHLDKHFNQL